MKHFLAFTALFLFSALAFGQNDFNYSFTPSPKYAKETKVETLDSLTQKVSWKRDSIGSGLAITVRKEGPDLLVSNLFNPSNVVYNEKVKFVGMDESGALIYDAQNETKERVYVNPVYGFVVVVFLNCEQSKFAKKREDCDKVVHLFGTCPKRYKP